MANIRFDVDRIVSIRLEESRNMLSASHFAIQQCTLGLRETAALLRTTERRIQDSRALLNGRLQLSSKAFSLVACRRQGWFRLTWAWVVRPWG